MLTSLLNSVVCIMSCIGVEPTTEATGGKCLLRIFGRCVTEPVSVQQAATAICSLCTDDKYKGSCSVVYDFINTVHHQHHDQQQQQHSHNVAQIMLIITRCTP